MGKVPVRLEASKSRSGLHATRMVAVVVGRESVRVLEERVSGERPTYSRGWAGTLEVEVPEGYYLVHARLTLTPQGRVKGRFWVYDDKGNLVLEAVLRKRKVRRVRGDPELGWTVEKAVEKLGLSKYVRGFNWSTGA